MIKGKATTTATQALSQQHPGQFRRLARPDLWVSQIGFGTQRVSLAEEDHYTAMKQAFAQGINLVDTCGYYMAGGAERLVGKVLADLEAEGTSREHFFIVSKAGLVDDTLFEQVQARETSDTPYENVLHLGRNLAYCIGGNFIEDQITASLERMGLDTIDCFMVHNPENILQHFERKRRSREEAYADYLSHLRGAFTQLEREVGRGRIACYGISCNTLSSPAEDFDFTSLADVLALAEEISADHHFAVVELPMNLLETAALHVANQPGGRSVVDFAEANQLGILVNRVLDAHTEKHWLRLTDLAPAQVEIGDLPALIDELNDLEEDVLYKLLPAYSFPAEELRLLKQQLSVGVALDQLWSSFTSHVHWQENRSFFAERVEQGIETLRTHPKRPEMAADLLDRYAAKIAELFEGLSGHYRGISAAHIGRLKEVLFGVRPQWNTETPMSHLALRAVREEPAVSCILLGMRKPAYVEDALAELRHSLVEADTSVLRQCELSLDLQAAS